MINSAFRRLVATAAIASASAAATVMGGVGQSSGQNLVCQAAANSGHCYAISQWGAQVGAPISFSEVGLDLEYDCIYTPNLSSDFINHETWMYTNTNFSHSNPTWIEQGYTNGPDLTTGTVYLYPYKYWADQRAANGNYNYAEHFIQYTNPNVRLDTGFQWVPNTNNWRVYNNHQQVGTSTNVGAFAGGADAGLEFTDLAAAAVGNGYNWRYKDGVNGTFHTAPSQVIYVTPGSGAAVSRQGGNLADNTSGGCPAANAAPPAAKAASPESATADLAPSVAKVYGGSDKFTSASSVATTRSAANALQGADVVGVQPVVLLELKGQFTGKQARTPKQVKPSDVTGNTLTVTLDAKTSQVLDWRISSQSHALGKLGKVVTR